MRDWRNTVAENKGMALHCCHSRARRILAIRVQTQMAIGRLSWDGAILGACSACGVNESKRQCFPDELTGYAQKPV
jgi:hypothetical protein